MRQDRQPPRFMVQRSADWLAYFTENLDKMPEIPWELGAGVNADELAAIVDSLRAWQLGETSDGLNLLAAARAYADDIGDPDFVEVIRLFIAEEQGHGALLGQFLDFAGVTRAQSDWGDSLFRFCRHLLTSMEVWTTTVVMVEAHAMVYYNAIRQATGSPVLRAICQRLLHDEVAHLRFQCERLAILHRHRCDWLLALTLALHYVLFAAITVAIWIGHRRALTAGGYSFRRFWRSAWTRMNQCWKTMNPRLYLWSTGTLGRTWLDESALSR